MLKGGMPCQIQYHISLRYDRIRHIRRNLKDHHVQRKDVIQALFYSLYQREILILYYLVSNLVLLNRVYTRLWIGLSWDWRCRWSQCINSQRQEKVIDLEKYEDQGMRRRAYDSRF